MATGTSRDPRLHGRRRSLVRLASLGLAAALTVVAVAPPAAAGSPSRGGLGPARRTTLETVTRHASVRVAEAARAASAHPRPDREIRNLKPGVDHSGSGRPRTGTAPAGSSPLSSAPAPLAPALASTPVPTVTTSFPGIAQNETCSCEPPDPWIAVSPGHVVQAVNRQVRIYSRSGAVLQSIPNWALFALPVDQSDADPRVLWDGAHARWVGVLASASADGLENYLWLAVSETSDPTAAWNVYAIATGVDFPDYPGIASASDKIVLTSNDFDPSETYVGPSAYVFDWSALLGGGPVSVGVSSFAPDAGATFRPAQLLSSSSTVFVVYDRSGDIGYFEIVGSAATRQIVNEHDLTTELGLAGFSDPPAPRQPGGGTITEAHDGRPTDAVWRNGHLWFVSSYDAVEGVDHYSGARWTEIGASAGATPSILADLAIALPPLDVYLPGVTIAGDGTAIFVATVSNATDTYPSTMVAALTPARDATAWHVIQTSSTAYAGSRWGDYVGVAADPIGTGAAWVADEVPASDGTWTTQVNRVVMDDVVPTAPGAPRQAIVIPSTLGPTSVPVRLSWTAGFDAGSGVEAHRLSPDIDGAGFESPSIVVGTSAVRPLLLGSTYQFRVASEDAVGLVSADSYGPIFTPTVYQQRTRTTYAGTWRTGSSASYSGGTTRHATAAGASATFSFTGRAVAFTTAKGPTRGRFKVYLDGRYKGTFSTYASRSRHRQVLYGYAWSSAGAHKLKIVVVGTAGHPRVDVDAFVVLR